MDDDPNPHTALYYTIDLSNAPVGPQQIEVTATGGGYTTDVVSKWCSFSGSGSASINFVITADPPIIDVLSPENKEYTNNTIPLLFNTQEETTWLGYRLDNLDMVTVDGNTTLTGLSDGYHIITVYANGTKWNSGNSNEVIFKVNALEGGNNSIPSLFWRTGIEWDLSGTPVQDLWEKQLEIKARTWKTPTVVDGIVYVGIEYRVQVNQYTTYEWIDVNAFNATSGVRLWNYRDISNDRIGRMSTPVAVDGVVYFGTFQNIYALNSNDGSLLWNYTTRILSPFTVVTGGKLFAGSQSELFVLNATDGHIIWNYTDNRAPKAVFIVDGVVYTSTSEHILALNETTGEKIWNTDIGDCTCAQVTNGSVYAYSYADVYSFDAIMAQKTGIQLLNKEFQLPQLQIILFT
jgi:outer membrane protein assembly factor BamB